MDDQHELDRVIADLSELRREIVASYTEMYDIANQFGHDHPDLIGILVQNSEEFAPDFQSLAVVCGIFNYDMDDALRHMADLIRRHVTKMSALMEAVRTGEGLEAFQHSEVITILNALDYKDYLETHHWKVTRAAARERAGNRCQVCNTGKRTLHVHHRTYERRGEELPDDLIVLCDQCHSLFHKNGKLAK